MTTLFDSDEPGLPWGCRTLLGGLACLLFVAGCDLQGVPRAGGDGGLRLSEDAGGDAVECTPGERTCSGSTRRVCTDEGVLQQEECEAGTTCQEGECVAIASSCTAAADNGDSAHLFSLSEADELRFEFEDADSASTEELRRTRTLDVENCTDQPLSVIADLDKDATSLPDSDFFSSVFTVDSPGRVEIAPGEQETIEISYNPRHALSYDPAALVIDVLGADFHRQTRVHLRPVNACATATPVRALDRLDEVRHDGVFFQNCGTEPIRLDDLDIDAADQASEEAVDITEREPHQYTSTLQPGEYHWIPLRIAPQRGGRFEYSVDYQLEGEAAEASTRIEGYATTGECRDETLEPPVVRTGVDKDDAPPGDDDNRHYQVPLGERIEFGLADSLESSGAAHVRLEPPEGSRASLDRRWFDDPDAQSDAFTTDVAGTYRLRLDHLDDDRRALCEPTEVVFEARPDDDLYVDLTWQSRAGEIIDPIGDDVGYNRGVDLNLHMTATDDLDDSTHVEWIDVVNGCFGLGEYPSSGEGRGPDSRRAGCESTDGDIDSLSIDGAHREILSVDDATRRFYHFGVMVWSMYEFSDVKYELRVMADGERVEEFEFRDDWWEGENPPRDPNSLLINQAMTPTHVWRFGVWDAETNTLIPYPRHSFDTRFPTTP